MRVAGKIAFEKPKNTANLAKVGNNPFKIRDEFTD